MSQRDLFFLAHQLMADYADLIDADRLEDWLDIFAEDATYCVMPRENLEQDLPASVLLCTSKAMLRDRMTALRRANEYNLHYDRHLISGIKIAPAAKGGWRLEANYAVFQTNLEGQSRLFSVGRYRDKVRLAGDRLVLTEKLVVVDSFSIPTLLATPL
jgi:anthranilate 1,2-dioxygenase small subunit